MTRSMRTVLAAASLLALGLPAGADVVTLTDNNATVVINTQSQDGMLSWTVDNVEHMYQQWFWFRVGPTGAEQSIDTLTQSALTLLDLSTAPGDDVMRVYYSHNLFTLEITYLLNGGQLGDGQSDIAEVLKISNITSNVLDLHFFQYCDFDLNGTPDDDTAIITGGNTASQSDAVYSMAETVVVRRPDSFEVNLYDDTLTRLNDGLPTTLNGNPGPLTGDVTWAFEWDFTIPPNSSVFISKDKMITPEPASLALLALGSAGMILRRRRRAKA